MTASTGENGERANAPNPPTEARGDIPADTFALRLVASRHHAGRLSIEQAAKMCIMPDGRPINAGTWHHWENGKVPRNQVDVAQAISDGLGMDFHWLLLGGPLLPARGRPVRKASPITGPYRRMPVRPQDTRPSGGPDRVHYSSAKQAVRRPRVIDRSQPVAV